MYQVDSGAYWESQALFWGPKILIALAILLATWFVARAAKWIIQKAIDRSPTLKKHIAGTPNETVGQQLGTVVKLIIWLVGIMAALSFLGVGQILEPINALTLDIFNFLPRLIGAGLIFFIGLIVARIVRRLVETLLTAANVDGLLARLGVGGEPVRAPGAKPRSRQRRDDRWPGGRGVDPRQPRQGGGHPRLCADHHSRWPSPPSRCWASRRSASRRSTCSTRFSRPSRGC